MIEKGGILKIYTDGAARGNPGPSASAFLLVYKSEIISQGVNFLGEATNNIAEYHAIINALRVSHKFHKGYIQVFSDSNLAVQQINKKWKINYTHLLELSNEVHKLVKTYQKVEFFHVPRSNPYIQKCDELCNEKLDSEIKS